MAALGKCLLLVTGPPGVGKTTLIMRVFESLKISNPNLKIQGFYTREIEKGVKGLALKLSLWMGGKPLLPPLLFQLGKMELFSSSFFPVVLKILESNVPVLASVPAPRFGHDIPGVARVKNHLGATMYTVSPSN